MIPSRRNRKKRPLLRRTTTTIMEMISMANIILLLTMSFVITASEGQQQPEQLVVCRNIRLDETFFKAPSFPGPPPYRSTSATENLAINNNEDAGLSMLLEESSSSSSLVSLRLRFRSSHPETVKLLGIGYYTTDGAGFQLGTVGSSSNNSSSSVDLGDDGMVISDDDPVMVANEENDDDENYRSLELRVPPESLVHPDNDGGGGHVHRLTVSYGIPSAVTAAASAVAVEDVQIRIKLVRLCSSEPMPYFCSETSIHTFQEHCHDCSCQTCHDCGCTEKLPWESCGDKDDPVGGNNNNGTCGADQSRCWCSPACVCCSDCEGYSCNCDTCCDNSTLSQCSLGSTYGITHIEPSDGMALASSEIMVRGKGFWTNGPNTTCRFGWEDNKKGVGGVVKWVEGHVLSDTELFCEAPPWEIHSDDPGITVPVSVSLDGLQYTDPVGFTYRNCPEGCKTENCSASVCKCPDHTYGPNCTLKCSDCEHGTCATVTGTCVCDDGYRGPKCTEECPGGSTNPCSGHGTCVFANNNDNDNDDNDDDKNNNNKDDNNESLSSVLCFCDEGFWGTACQHDCPKDQNNVVCGGKGTCDANVGVCRCYDGYYGESCTEACPGLLTTTSICSGRGVCCTTGGGPALQSSSSYYSQCDHAPIGTCACDAGRTGESCQDTYCFQDCYNHGSCGPDGICVCDDDYSGEFCSLKTGQNTSVSYVSFLGSKHTVVEEGTTVSLEVTRFGRFVDEISVGYETKDLTAKANEDYTPVSGRLSWSSMDGSKRFVNVSIAVNDWPEGEESFEVVLSSPLPKHQCLVGGTGITLVRIRAKPEESISNNDGDVLARIRVKLLRPFYLVKPGEVAGEELKAVFLRACVDAIGAAPDRFYLQGISPSSSATTTRTRTNNNNQSDTTDNNVILTFDILPSSDENEIDIRDASSAFSSAVGDPSSPLYSDAMKEKCPIDVSFPPEVRFVSFGGGSSNNNIKTETIVVLYLLLFLSIITISRCLFRRRYQLQEGFHRIRAKRKYQELRTFRSTINSVIFEEEGEDEDGTAASSSGHTNNNNTTDVATYGDNDNGGDSSLRDTFKKMVSQIELT